MALANEPPVPLEFVRCGRPNRSVVRRLRVRREPFDQVAKLLDLLPPQVVEMGFDLLVDLGRLPDHEAHRLLIELNRDARMAPGFRSDGGLNVVDDRARIENRPLGVVEKHQVPERIRDDRRFELRVTSRSATRGSTRCRSGSPRCGRLA